MCGGFNVSVQHHVWAIIAGTQEASGGATVTRKCRSFFACWSLLNSHKGPWRLGLMARTFPLSASRFDPGRYSLAHRNRHAEAPFATAVRRSACTR